MGALVRRTTIARIAMVAALLAMAPQALAAEEGASVPDAVIGHVLDGRGDIVLENPILGGALLTIPWPDEGTWAVEIGGTTIDLTPSHHLFYMWVATALLILVMTLVARKRSIVPRGFYSMMETLVKFVRDELAVKNIGEKYADAYVPFLCTAFFFIFTVNALGLIPYGASATGNIMVTAGLALCTFGMMLFAGMKGQGVVRYWLNIVPSGVPLWLYPIMIPIELMGLVAKPFALAVRLFANMVAGHLVLFFLIALIFLLPGLPVVVTPVSLAFSVAIFFLEIFVAFLQAYIFTMLSALFIGMSAHAH